MPVKNQMPKKDATESKQITWHPLLFISAILWIQPNSNTCTHYRYLYIYLFINSIFSSKISLVSGVPVPIVANPIEITELQKSSLKHTHPPLTDHRLAMCPIIIKRMAHLPPFQHFLFTVQPAPIRKGTYRCSASLLGYRKASVEHIHWGFQNLHGIFCRI